MVFLYNHLKNAFFYNHYNVLDVFITYITTLLAYFTTHEKYILDADSKTMAFFQIVWPLWVFGCGSMLFLPDVSSTTAVHFFKTNAAAVECSYCSCRRNVRLKYHWTKA